MNLSEEFQSIRNWAIERNLYEKGDLKTQLTKLMEEHGELAQSILKNDRNKFIDSIGDMVVVLTNLAEIGNILFSKTCTTCHGLAGHWEDVAGDGGPQQFISCECQFGIEECINAAYDEIKNRTGKMVNGTFVKDQPTGL